MTDPQRCELPGCTTPLPEPTPGRPPRRYCSAEHRSRARLHNRRRTHESITTADTAVRAADVPADTKSAVTDNRDVDSTHTAVAVDVDVDVDEGAGPAGLVALAAVTARSRSVAAGRALGRRAGRRPPNHRGHLPVSARSRIAAMTGIAGLIASGAGWLAISDPVPTSPPTGAFATSDQWVSEAHLRLAAIDRQLATISQAEAIHQTRRAPQDAGKPAPPSVARLAQRKALLLQQQAALRSQVDTVGQVDPAQTELAAAEKDLSELDDVLAATNGPTVTQDQVNARAALKRQRDMLDARVQAKKNDLQTLVDSAEAAKALPLPVDDDTAAKLAAAVIADAETPGSGTGTDDDGSQHEPYTPPSVLAQGRTPNERRGPEHTTSAPGDDPEAPLLQPTHPGDSSVAAGPGPAAAGSASPGGVVGGVVGEVVGGLTDVLPGRGGGEEPADAAGLAAASGNGATSTAMAPQGKASRIADRAIGNDNDGGSSGTGRDAGESVSNNADGSGGTGSTGADAVLQPLAGATEAVVRPAAAVTFGADNESGSDSGSDNSAADTDAGRNDAGSSRFGSSAWSGRSTGTESEGANRTTNAPDAGEDQHVGPSSSGNDDVVVDHAVEILKDFAESDPKSAEAAGLHKGMSEQDWRDAARWALETYGGYDATDEATDTDTDNATDRDHASSGADSSNVTGGDASNNGNSSDADGADAHSPGDEPPAGGGDTGSGEEAAHSDSHDTENNDYGTPDHDDEGGGDQDRGHPSDDSNYSHSDNDSGGHSGDQADDENSDNNSGSDSDYSSDSYSSDYSSDSDSGSDSHEGGEHDGDSDDDSDSDDSDQGDSDHGDSSGDSDSGNSDHGGGTGDGDSDGGE